MGWLIDYENCKYVWDIDKHTKNQLKHHVSFQEAKTVFRDKNIIMNNKLITERNHHTKFITREEISLDVNPKKFSVTVEYDLSDETEDDEYDEFIECQVDVVRALLYDKLKEIENSDHLYDKLNMIFSFIEKC